MGEDRKGPHRDGFVRSERRVLSLTGTACRLRPPLSRPVQKGKTPAFLAGPLTLTVPPVLGCVFNILLKSGSAEKAGEGGGGEEISLKPACQLD